MERRPLRSWAGRRELGGVGSVRGGRGAGGADGSQGGRAVAYSGRFARRGPGRGPALMVTKSAWMLSELWLKAFDGELSYFFQVSSYRQGILTFLMPLLPSFAISPFSM